MDPACLIFPVPGQSGTLSGGPMSFITFRLAANNLFQNKKHNKCKTLE